MTMHRPTDDAKTGTTAKTSATEAAMPTTTTPPAAPTAARKPPRPIRIRPSDARDAEAVLALLLPIVREGTTYALDRDMSRSDALAYWFAPDKAAYVAEDAESGAIVGAYYLRANQGGGGRHVCNCGYIVSASARGEGIARRLGEHSFAEGKARGYRAMQFNFVVSANAPAVHLWQALDFAIVGRLPEAFAHPEKGYVDALVMMRPL